MNVIRICVLVFFMVLSFISTNQVYAGERISGLSRYDTAVEISKQGWDRAEVVVLARGNDFPDALAGASLAYQYDAPILLTYHHRLHESTERELIRLRVKIVVILGGNSAVSYEVERKLISMGLEFERIGGKNRYDTAALIAEKMPSQQAIIASGANFPDALAVAPYAAHNGIPILLTHHSTLPQETRLALQGKTNSLVVGGTGVISQEVMNELPPAVRYSGSDRYGTADEIIKRLPLGNNKAFVATGGQFADALAGSVLAAKRNAPIILTNATRVPRDVRTTVNQGQFSKLTYFGGVSAINEATRFELQSILLVDGDVTQVKNEEWEVFLRVNQEREEQQVHQLRLYVDLSKIARTKSTDMHDEGYFAHTSPTYGSPHSMMRDFGFNGQASGENIAAGYTDSSWVMDGWMNSPGHRSNILNETFTHVGVGYHLGNKEYKHYWTQLFFTPWN